MKKLFFLLQIVLFCFAGQLLTAQTLVGTSNCNSATASVSTFVNAWGYNMLLGDCSEKDCCKRILNWSGWLQMIYGSPAILQPKNYTLFNSVSLLPVAGPQSSPTFNDLPHGTYKIIADVPVRDFCSETGTEPVELYGSEGTGNDLFFVGYLGHFVQMSSNWFVVGATTQNDFFETALSNTEEGGPATETFCPEEEVYLYDFSTNYDLYWIAIFENGGLNRWESNYWVSGTIESRPSFNLSELWRKNHTNWDFEEGLSYTVQFVIENSVCINSQEWNVKDLKFEVKPCFSGSPDDRSDLQSKDQTAAISFFPNPASSFLMIKNINTTEGDMNYKILIQDIIGKTVLESSKSTEFVDISHIPGGSYFVSVYQSGQRVFTDKLIIQH